MPASPRPASHWPMESKILRPGRLAAHQTAQQLGISLDGVRQLVRRSRLHRSGGSPRQPWYTVQDVATLAIKRQTAAAASRSDTRATEVHKPAGHGRWTRPRPRSSRSSCGAAGAFSYPQRSKDEGPGALRVGRPGQPSSRGRPVTGGKRACTLYASAREPPPKRAGASPSPAHPEAGVSRVTAHGHEINIRMENGPCVHHNPVPPLH